MTVNGRTEEVKSVLYVYAEASDEDFDENAVVLCLFRDVVSEIPEDPDFAISIEMMESLLGKTIDLTEPVGRNSYLTLTGLNDNNDLNIDFTGDTIDTYGEATVTGGTLLVTRSGDDFTVKFSVTLSDGGSASADWKGKATKVVLPE